MHMHACMHAHTPSPTILIPKTGACTHTRTHTIAQHHPDPEDRSMACVHI